LSWIETELAYIASEVTTWPDRNVGSIVDLYAVNVLRAETDYNTQIVIIIISESDNKDEGRSRSKGGILHTGMYISTNRFIWLEFSILLLNKFIFYNQNKTIVNTTLCSSV